MPFVPDLIDGDIAKNILKALQNCPPSEIVKLKNSGAFATKKDNFTLNYRMLKYHSLELYAEKTGMPLCYFFFGTVMPPVPTYTPYDGKLIPLLNSMSDQQLEKLYQFMFDFFYNPLFSLETNNPDKKLFALLSRARNSSKASEAFSFRKITRDLTPDLNRYAASHYASTFAFVSDNIPDLATYTGASLHWIFDFKKLPLFCRSWMADRVFSLYTLLMPEQWEQFERLVEYILCGDLTPYRNLRQRSARTDG